MESLDRITFLKMVFGFSLLIVLATLAAVFALGKVEESSSYGLLPIITALATLAGAFANWAFAQHPAQEEKRSDQKPEMK